MDDYYWWYKEHGICIRCKQEQAQPGKTLCFECNEKEKARKRREYGRVREKRIERGKKRYLLRKAQGLCVYCGKKKAVQGRVSCIECSITQRRYVAERNLRDVKLPKGMREELHICRYCDKPAVDGYYYCRVHLEAQRKTAEKMRAAISAKRSRRELSARAAPVKI